MSGIGQLTLSGAAKYISSIRGEKFKTYTKEKGEQFIPIYEMDTQHIQALISLLRKKPSDDKQRRYWEWRLQFELNYRVYTGDRIVQKVQEQLPALRGQFVVELPQVKAAQEARVLRLHTEQQA